MFVTRSYSQHLQLAATPEVRSSVHIPMVYEHVAPTPPSWEYHVLTIDPREAPLPDPEQLNALGREGWIMVGLLDERASGKGGLLYYYFARQAKEETQENA